MTLAVLQMCHADGVDGTGSVTNVSSGRGKAGGGVPPNT
jgi:hypothetical protein